MANCFLIDGHEEIETAILLEKATQTDLSTISSDYANVVAFTDGEKVFINSDDNLAEILPNYNRDMLKWLLWHEEYHKQLKHHERYFEYLKELQLKENKKYHDKFQITTNEVNTIMDILVHDSLSKMFPELVETAVSNLAQMRNRNSLGYTFKTHNLEDMLNEYAEYKHKNKDKEQDNSKSQDSEREQDNSKNHDSENNKKGHAKGGKGGSPKEKDSTDGKDSCTLNDEHNKTDWSKLTDISKKEFIEPYESYYIENAINELKKKKFRLAKLTEALNGMVTTEKIRTYSRPNYIGLTDKNIILKGRKYAKTKLYLVFDASGSMGSELALFKEIISKAVPQAMKVPCEWFAGCHSQIPSYKTDCIDGYYKGIFKDIIPVWASSGYDDDGDRVIELCLEAEKQGYSPIGVTDGGGGIYAPEVLKQLQRTVLIGSDKHWLERAKSINPKIQILVLDD